MSYTFAVRLRVWLFTLAACSPTLDPGEFGTLRYFGNVPDDAPLSMVPPLADRAGNLYVLFGDIVRTDTTAFIGYAAGGWSGACPLTRGSAVGLHGWVGVGRERAWYWSGDGLFGLRGATGDCRELLKTDPSTGAALRFLAVVPSVRESTSRATTVAWVSSNLSAPPQQVLIDLDQNVLRALETVTSASTSNVVVHGAGADTDDAGAGVIVATLVGAEASRTEARFIGSNGKTATTAIITGTAPELPHALTGPIQGDDSGLFAGVTATSLLLFDRNGGAWNALPDGAVGVHRNGGKLWLVGASDAGPFVREITGQGAIGPAKAWASSTQASAHLGTVDVVDDRSLPATTVQWSATNGLGSHPFVHPHSPNVYGEDQTLWVVAGPSFKAGGVTQTAAAVAAVGIAYP